MGGLDEVRRRIVREYGLARIADEVAWVSEFFKREELYLRSIGAPTYDRPLGTMHKKHSVRKGYVGEGMVLAYARWDKRNLSPLTLDVVMFRYRDQYRPGAWEAFLDDEKPREPYERIGILTPRALYSGAGHDPVLRRFGFDGTFTAGFTLEPMIAEDIESQEPGVPIAFTAPYLADEPIESSIGRPPFTLFGSFERVRSPSR